MDVRRLTQSSVHSVLSISLSVIQFEPSLDCNLCLKSAFHLSLQALDVNYHHSHRCTTKLPGTLLDHGKQLSNVSSRVTMRASTAAFRQREIARAAIAVWSCCVAPAAHKALTAATALLVWAVRWSFEVKRPAGVTPATHEALAAATAPLVWAVYRRLVIVRACRIAPAAHEALATTAALLIRAVGGCFRFACQHCVVGKFGDCGVLG